MALSLLQETWLPPRDCHASLAMTVRLKLGTREGEPDGALEAVAWAGGGVKADAWGGGVEAGARGGGGERAVTNRDTKTGRNWWFRPEQTGACCRAPTGLA